ncbi:GMP/IMP nucleotidase [uncultured Thiothrix sp.]|uniref:GMP/IMP nucleotidase n=1 Tax=uncultured Thiothrix sp. TaxID=223185 RepID=UPI0026070FB1|nr:GMP/IMP nucleotidase [uncultured Thiothrix sp.]HMT92209.1 GMP/IMP nucleotidase [Thiolinea sp.]
MPSLIVPWSEISTVFLDMDGTLLDLHFDNHFWLEHLPKRVAEHKQLSVTEVEQMVNEHCAQIEGSLNWYCLDYWQAHLGMDLVALKYEIAERIAMRAHVEEFLTHLRQLNKRIVLLTNAHRKSVNLKFEYVNLEPYFDRIITSHEIGLAKEEGGFWERLLATENFDKNHSLFIDDNLQVLRAAQQYGLKYLLAVREPDSKLPPKETAEFAAVSCYQELMK